jgi:adenylate cyclase
LHAQKFKLPSLKKIFSAGRLAGLSMIAAFVVLRVWDPAPVEIVRSQVFDLYQRADPRAAAGYPVTIVDIDEKSLAAIGQWPWSRALIARIVDKLREGGAAVVGFDVIFAEPDRLSPPRLATTLELSDGDLRRKLAAMQDSDQRLAQAIKSARVVLGHLGHRDATVREKNSSGASLPETSVAIIGGGPGFDLIRLPGVLKSLPEFENAAAGRGLLTVQPERDGVIRRAPLIISAGGIIAPGLAIELLRVAAGASSIVVKRDNAGVKSVVVAGAEVQTDADGQLWVAFRKHDPSLFVSAADVLTGEVPAERISGKIVIVGTSAAGLFDLKSTPLERVMPGVEIHAQIIESILSDSTLNRPNYALGVEITLALVIGIATVIAVPLMGALPSLLLGALVATVLVAVSWYLFAAEKMLIDMSYPLGSSFATLLFMTFMNYFREERRRTQIRRAFRQYLSPELVEHLAREPDRLVLGGETREISILFSDVRDFTSIAEGFKSNPSGLTALMNRLLTPLSHAIIERRGTIDKYIGDAIIAFWNAPLDDPDHALNACESALEILRRFDELNARRRKESIEAGTTLQDMQIGIGIATGFAVVGNMGSDIRFDYSVLGDSVNLASRLEALTAVYGVRILIAEDTARRCRDELAIVEVDRVRVKGKRNAETISVLAGGQDLSRSEHFQAFRRSFDSMRRNYIQKNWARAMSDLSRCREMQIERFEEVLDIYSARLLQLAKTPPAQNWDGVFKAQTPVS